MRHRLRAEWQAFKYAPVGSRFEAYYERHQARDAPYLKALLFFATVFVLGMAVLLTFVPGPALVFYLLSLALLPGESRTVAALFDRTEAYARGQRKRSRPARPFAPLPPEPDPPQVEYTPPEALAKAPVRPRVAGTIKIWTADLPAAPPAREPPPPAAKDTLVVFPPPPGAGNPDRPSR